MSTKVLGGVNNSTCLKLVADALDLDSEELAFLTSAQKEIMSKLFELPDEEQVNATATMYHKKGQRDTAEFFASLYATLGMSINIQKLNATSKTKTVGRALLANVAYNRVQAAAPKQVYFAYICASKKGKAVAGKGYKFLVDAEIDPKTTVIVSESETIETPKKLKPTKYKTVAYNVKDRWYEAEMTVYTDGKNLYVGVEDYKREF